MAGESDYTTSELARLTQGALSRMESLAARLEGGQFLSTQLWNVWKAGLDAQLENLKAEIGKKADMEKIRQLEAEITSLKDDRKWLVRALVLFIITTVLGVVFASAGGGLP